jgi:tetratricopeptide (TPR) repeat protein
MQTRWVQTAAEHLDQGRVEEAMRLSLEGTRVHPWYATGHLVLGRCFERLKRLPESLIAYRNALAVLPDNPMLQKLVRDAEYSAEAEFAAFRLEQGRRLEGTADRQSLGDFLGGKEPLEDQAKARGLFVTPTLAEIYASQGEFGEAIDAYKTLAEHRPEQETRFRERIKQLQELARQRGEAGGKTP